ncbi:hypothetical protein [Streptomyces europaeiscabiei]|uniref:hypothetical protein n=1 Tax=Streptomyces europaeiscabiei TaxID=146819 RepID=UPI002E1374F3|nr:hypothetical protein OHB30_28130 [Streptomyces europaeiscabiei]
MEDFVRIGEAKRLTLLASLIHVLRAAARDEVTDMFCKRMAIIHRKGKAGWKSCVSNTAPDPSGYVHLIPSDFWREVVVDVAAYEVLLQNVLEGDLLRPQRRVHTVG